MFANSPSRAEEFYRKPPDPDPVLVDAAAGRRHINPATGAVLFHQSVMPLGEHIGKIMERVPASYYLYLARQAWFSTSSKWAQVRSYIERHRHEIEVRAATETSKVNTFNPTAPQ